ncbi:MAG: beta galactosidase jelly roll domain-containing protein [Bacteroidetes bacterium]|nr:beta galactosidase jelly roll domain-containing protein [Bacteroidota bacterium]
MLKLNIKILTLVTLLSLLSVKAMGEDWYRVLSLRGMWKFTIGDNREWAKSDYDDGDWESIYAPSAWENEGFHGYNGHAWYRRSFDGRELEIGSKLYIHLGYIDDVDEVYINGQLVGSSGSFPPRFNTAYNAYRKYFIPQEYLNFQGENVIAVRVYDVIFGGGIVSGRIGIYVDRDQMYMDVDLQGIWQFKIGDNQQWRKKDLDHSNWRTIMVPSIWEKQGYHQFDGFAWYRKTFYVPEDIDTDDVILLLGKIDDFDQTYINGEEVGFTKDYKPLGGSGSYRQLRTYYLPKGLLISGEENTIAVRVEDMGGEGGIYEGPVGLASRESYTQFWRWRR